MGQIGHRLEYSGHLRTGRRTPDPSRSAFECAYREQDGGRRTAKQREEYPGIGPRRAEIIVAGAFVFAEMMTHYDLPSFRYSPLGLRDGLLAQMAADYDPNALQRSQLEAERQDALLET